MPASADAIRARGRCLAACRGWFADHGYVEVLTPCVVPSAAMEEHLHPVHLLDGGSLRTSPEFALKGAMAQGLGRIYEIGPCFRDREAGPWHRREFTLCEWYRAGAQLPDLMDEVVDLVDRAAAGLGVTPPRWRRTTVHAAMLAATGLDLDDASPRDLSGVDEGWDDAFARRWVTDVEPTLQGGVFVADWPPSQAALAQIWTSGARPVACRFEVYVDGIELANAFQELIDPVEQRRRFDRSNRARIAAGEAPHPVDEALITAVGRMPSTAGIALGVDRLVAILMGWAGIGSDRQASVHHEDLAGDVAR